MEPVVGVDNGGGVVDQKISKEDVISKFKDDGDFDRLRVKIIRKLKENEELRDSIVSVVKQSAALNRPGIENMKPRQLSDAIHEEVRDKVMNQISDGVWEIIRSGDGMKNEIKETVESVYNRLLNPKGNELGEPSSNSDAFTAKNIPDSNGSVMANETDGTFSDGEPNEPPGFSLHGLHQNNHEEQPKEEQTSHIPGDKLPTEEEKEEAHRSQNVLETDAMNLTRPPTVSTVMEQKQRCDGGDDEDDPDLPPGFS